MSRPDAHDVAEREPPLQPAVRDDADDRRPTATAVVRRPNPTSPMPSRSARVEDEHRPRRPERDVEGEDRQRQGPHRRMRRGASGSPPPSPPAGSIARAARSSWWSRRARRAPRRARSRPRSSRTASPCRRRTGRRRSAAPRAGSSAGRRPACRALAMPRSSRATMPGRSVLLAESAKVSAVPRTNRATRTMAMLTVPLTIVATRTTSASGPAEVDHDDHAPPVEAVGRGAAEDAEQQDRQVLAQHRQRDEERVARQRRDEQRAGRDHDAVADVVDDRGRQEPAEAPSEPRRARRLRSVGRAGSAPAAGYQPGSRLRRISRPRRRSPPAGCSEAARRHSPASPNVARPAGRYVWIVTPDGVALESSSVRSCVCPCSGNSRSPSPRTTG